jgi:lipoprotein signal peptidase
VEKGSVRACGPGSALAGSTVPSSHGWWPAYNLADSCICIAAVMWFIGGLREEAANGWKQLGMRIITG